jgi:hypothetical protein
VQGEPCEARVVRAAVGVHARRAVAAVPGVAPAAVPAGPVVVARGVGVARVELGVIAGEDLVARWHTGPAADDMALVAGAPVSVWAGVAARARPRRTARVVRAVVNVVTGLAIAVPARWTVATGEAVAGGRYVRASHALKAWTVCTSVGVIARCAISAVPGGTFTAVLARSVMVARGIDIACVRLSVITWEHLVARTVAKRVSIVACTLINVRTSVCAHTDASPTRISNTVVDVAAGDAITIVAGRTRVTGEAIIRRRLVMTFHLRMIKARICFASVGVITRRADSAVSGIAGAAVQAWPIMIARGVGITVVQVNVIAREYFRTSAASLCVSKAACARI